MSKYGSSYKGNDFLEWWKHHYGTDYDGSGNITKSGSMTDEDVAIGKSLLNSYNQQQHLTNQYNQNVQTETDKYNSLIESSDKAYDSKIEGAQSEYDRSAQLLLENYNRNTANAKEIYDKNTAELLANYGTAQDALDKSKRQSQQNASITLDKLKKYLPTQIKAQGLGGLGVSESSMLQAYNNYNSDMGAIESGYQESKSDLDTNYNTNKNAYDTQYQQTQGDLDALYGESKANLEGNLASAKSGFKTAKAQASDTYKAQLADTLAKLKQNYDTGIFNSDKDAQGNLLVDNVLAQYAQELASEQGVNFDIALAAIKNAVYTDMGEMNSFIENYRSGVNDEQFAALLQEGKNTVGFNLDNKNKEEKARLEKEQETAFNNALTAISQSSFSTEAEMNNFVEQFRGSVSATQFAALLQTGKGIITENSAKYARETVKNAIAEMLSDPSNYYNVENQVLSENGRNKILAYIEQNKATLGDSDYTAEVGALNSRNYYANADRDTDINAMISDFNNNTNHNSRLEQYAAALSGLDSLKGTMSESEYNAFLSQITGGTRTDYTNYYVQGLGSGRNNDDIDITIGSTDRNRKKEYDLLCGDEITNASAKALLNRLTTGSDSVTPSNGRLCVVANKMYIYTKKGWRIVKNDNDDIIDKAIQDFLSNGK